MANVCICYIYVKLGKSSTTEKTAHLNTWLTGIFSSRVIPASVLVCVNPLKSCLLFILKWFRCLS